MAGQLGSPAYSSGARHGHWHSEMVQCTKGFGFIQSVAGGTDGFVHISALERAGFRGLYEGQGVAYEIVADKRTGKSSVDNLKTA
jgi:cold shock protein